MTMAQRTEIDGSTERPLHARAWVNDRLVATSSRAVRIEQPGGAPMLCFPAGDLKGELPAGTDELLLPSAPDGYVAFNPGDARVRLTLVDDCGSTDERDRTLKRFPTWGDAADLIDLLNVRRDAGGSYVSVTRDSAASAHREIGRAHV